MAGLWQSVARSRSVIVVVAWQGSGIPAASPVVCPGPMVTTNHHLHTMAATQQTYATKENCLLSDTQTQTREGRESPTLDSWVICSRHTKKLRRFSYYMYMSCRCICTVVSQAICLLHIPILHKSLCNVRVWVISINTLGLQYKYANCHKKNA